MRIGTFEVFSSYFLSSLLTQEFSTYEALLLELTPGKLEEAILDNIVDIGLTYIPSPDSRLEFTEVGQFEMAIWGCDKWLKIPFNEWPFAVPTTLLQIHSVAQNSLDMWPRSKKGRRIKYEFELLETALQTSRMGHSVLHCPDFIIEIHNQQISNEFQLRRLPYPAPIKSLKPIKIFLVSKKGSHLLKLVEGKVAKFLRSF